MNATEEWLRYVENTIIKQKYGVVGYKDDDEDDKEESNEENKEE